jgi:CBS-domain-containing membrane protein
LAAFFEMGWLFLLVPVLTGSVLLVLLAWGFSRVGQHRGPAGRKIQPAPAAEHSCVGAQGGLAGWTGWGCGSRRQWLALVPPRLFMLV